MIDEKYIVFDRKAFNEFASFAIQHGHSLDDLGALTDAVVIRTQDVFAYSGLAAYANTIRTHVALVSTAIQRGEIDEEPRVIGMMARMESIAQYFEGCADEAEDRIARGECKVPD